MSRIYKHGHYHSDLTMDNVNNIVDVIETYLCNYKLGFHLICHRTHLTHMNIYKLNSKSLLATYSFKFNTLTLYKRKALQGVVSLEQMKEENSKRGYLYDEYF